MKFAVMVDLEPINSLMERLGLTPDGAAQEWLTNSIMGRLDRYMPEQSSALVKSKRMISPHEILVEQPYAHYQWKSKLMVDRVTGSAWSNPKHGPKVYKKPTQFLDHSKGKNPQAGPNWEEKLMAAEGAQIAEDLAKYIERRKS